MIPTRQSKHPRVSRRGILKGVSVIDTPLGILTAVICHRQNDGRLYGPSQKQEITPGQLITKLFNWKVARYTMNGTFLGLTDLEGGDLQFCKASESVLDAAFIFGTTYEREVR